MAEQQLPPATSFIGKGVPGTLKMIKADKKGTQGYEGQVEITQDGPWKGTRLLWKKYNSEGQIERNLEQLMLAGCTFPGDDTTNLTGWGDTDGIVLQVGHEPGQLKDANDPSKGKYPDRAECAWINEGLGGRGNTEITDPAEKAAFQASTKGSLAAARAKRAGTAAPVATSGIPTNPDGTPKF